MMRKKIVSLLLVLGLIMSLMPTNICVADETVTLTIEADKSEARPGDMIKYTVKMGPVQNLSALQIMLSIPEGLNYEGLNENNLKNSLANILNTDTGSINYDRESKMLTVVNCGSNVDESFSSTNDTELMTFSCTVNDDASGDLTVGFIENEGSNVRTKLARSSSPEDVFALNLTGATTIITAPPVSPTGVSLNNHEIQLTEGKTQELTAEISPAGATGTLCWDSSNGSCATVKDDGTVTAVGIGTSIITVSIDGTDYSDSCIVNVTSCPHENTSEIAAHHANCTEAGNNRYYYCLDCKKYLKADKTTETTQEAETIPSLGHDYYGAEYSSDNNKHWIVCRRCNEESTKENHTWGSATYTWSNDNSTCTARHTCTVCGKEIYETVDTGSDVTAATCTEAEKTKYTAVFTKPGFNEQTKVNVETGDALGHNWGDTQCEWSSDYSECTAKRKCQRSGCNEIQSETVETLAETTATCTEAGIVTYTATFTNNDFNLCEERQKSVAVSPLGHDFQDVITQAATADMLGVKQRKCSRCYEVSETTLYVSDSTSPNKYPDGKFITDGDTISANATGTLSVGSKNKTINVLLQDPLGVFEGHTISLAINSITNDLGEEYDGNLSVHKAYKADLVLKTDGVETHGQLPGKVRLLLEIPDDYNNFADNWDDDNIIVQRINIGEDTFYVERIEYQVYDAESNFIKTVDKDYVPKDGESLRKFAAVWTDHFSQYAAIEVLDDNHIWSEATYTWSDDYSKCTATRSCLSDGCTETETETTTDISKVTTATCAKAGTTTYTATFENEAFCKDSDADKRKKTVDAEALGHVYQEVVTQEATADILGIKQKKCPYCEDVSETKSYALDNTSPNKYPDGKFITGVNTVSAKMTGSLVIGGEDKKIEILLQDPMQVYEGHTISIVTSGITSDLGAEFDGSIRVEKAYKANVGFKVDGTEIQGQLPGKVRLLMEIPDDFSNSDDDWDDEELQVLRINTGQDTDYNERIEYQVYDGNGNFVKIVDKDYVPGAGENLRKFAVVWTDHFSQYAVIDELTDKDTAGSFIDKLTDKDTTGSEQKPVTVITDKPSVNEKTTSIKDKSPATGDSGLELSVVFCLLLASCAAWILMLIYKKEE